MAWTIRRWGNIIPKQKKQTLETEPRKMVVKLSEFNNFLKYSIISIIS